MTSNTEIEEIIKKLEEIKNNLPTDEAEIKKAMDYVDKTATDVSYNLTDTDITNFETTITSIDKLNDDTITDLDEFMKPQYQDIMAQSGDLPEVKKSFKEDIIKRIIEAETKMRDAVNNFIKSTKDPATEASKYFMENLNGLNSVLTMIKTQTEEIILWLEKFDPSVRITIYNFEARMVLSKLKSSGHKIRPVPGRVYGKTPHEPTTDLIYDEKKLTQKIKIPDLTILINDANNVISEYNEFITDKGLAAERSNIDKFIINAFAATVDDTKAFLVRYVDGLIKSINALADTVLDTYLATIVQKGGAKSLKERLRNAFRRKILIIKLNKIIQYLQSKLSPGTSTSGTTSGPTSGTTSGPSTGPVATTNFDSTDYAKPLLSLVSYKMGALNEFDIQLITYCQQIGFDPNTIIAIHIAQKREEIEPIFKNNYRVPYTALTNITRLKKMSAEKKFRQDYGITSDQQVSMLISIATIVLVLFYNNKIYKK